MPDQKVVATRKTAIPPEKVAELPKGPPPTAGRLPGQGVPKGAGVLPGRGLPKGTGVAPGEGRLPGLEGQKPRGVEGQVDRGTPGQMDPAADNPWAPGGPGGDEAWVPPPAEVNDGEDFYAQHPNFLPQPPSGGSDKKG